MKSVERLESLLQYWEARCAFTLAMLRIEAHRGNYHEVIPSPYNAYASLRPMLNQPTKKHDSLNGLNTSVTADDVHFHGHTLGMLMPVPDELLLWSQRSRRVYSVTEDLQTLLTLTSLKDCQWRDLRFPFDSFVLQLPTPVFADYDTILVSRHVPYCHFSDSLVIRLISRDIATHLQDEQQSRQINELCELTQQRRWRQAGKIYDAVKARNNPSHRGLRDMLVTEFISLDGAALADLPLTATAQEVLEASYKKVNWREAPALKEKWSEYTYIMRLVAGFCLYLQHIPPTAYGNGDWTTPPPPKRPPNPPTLRTNIHFCAITSSFTLTTAERDALRTLGRSGLELQPHFREGYWHRPRGQGHNPDHPKTEWTRPTIVNAKLLAPGELPGGAAKTIPKPVA